MATLDIHAETFPIRGTFTISRGSRTEINVLVATIADGGMAGSGECVPYARYDETMESVAAQIESARTAIEAGIDREELQTVLPAGAARNALDCALIDLEAKKADKPAWQILGLPAPEPLVTAFTISLGSPETMAENASAAADRPLLKVKLGGEGDIERIQAVRRAAPGARLIVDANEAWTEALLAPNLAAMADCRVELVEQPLPAGADGMLADLDRPVPICADESCHDRAGLQDLVGRYDYINIKLDKTGGLSEAVELARIARSLDLEIMVGCMLGTSLGMAPAMLLGPMAGFVDLDGPLLLAQERANGLTYRGSVIEPADPALWG